MLRLKKKEKIVILSERNRFRQNPNARTREIIFSETARTLL